MNCILDCNNLKNSRLDKILDPSCDHVESHNPIIQFMKASPEMYSKVGLPLEEKHIQNAVSKRQQEFRAGRHAARAAIRKLFPSDNLLIHQPILVGSSREPIFPVTITGSISHTDSLCVAACALKSDVASLGIDIEHNHPLDNHHFPAVYTNNEQAWLAQAGSIPNILIFSIKESLFKCLFPFVKVYFDFLEAEITLQPETENSGQFQFELIGENRCFLQSALPNLAFQGYYCFSEQHVFSLCFYAS